jgi:hypothetical protein
MRSLAILAIAALFTACGDDEEPETCRAFVVYLCHASGNICAQYVDDCALTDDPGVCEWRGDLVLCEGAEGG